MFDPPRPTRRGDVLSLPALTTAHSHAFQRALRGRAQRPGPSGRDDFWSWRTAMYELAAGLTPESMYAIAKVAYRELFSRGVRTVGEFHYVHHDPSGRPYADRTILADAVIRAAKDVGMRIALLRVAYHRAGPGRGPVGAQLRFADARLDDVLRDVEALAQRYRDDPDVQVGVAPHSVRAVPPAWLNDLSAYLGTAPDTWCHMHVAEQPAEIDACRSETDRTPVELLSEVGLLGPRFVAVHATHLADHEVELLGQSGSSVCLCPTTERDLGDGLPQVGPMVRAGVRFAVGIDSHVMCAPLEELRGIEMGERLRVMQRNVLSPAAYRDAQGISSPAELLWHIGSNEGARVLGFESNGGRVEYPLSDLDLEFAEDERSLDALVYSLADPIPTRVVRA